MTRNKSPRHVLALGIIASLTGCRPLYIEPKPAPTAHQESIPPSVSFAQVLVDLVAEGIPVPTSSAAGDFNGDGFTDVAIAGDTMDGAIIGVMLGDGAGRFDLRANVPLGTGTVTAIATGDFDEDGSLDMVAASEQARSVAVLLGNDDGSFRASPPRTIGAAPYAISAADIDGDGNLDLATANRSDHSMSVLFGDGHGAFGAGSIGAATGQQEPVAIGFGSLIGDQYADAVLILQSVGQGTRRDVVLMMAQGDGSFPKTIRLGDALAGSPAIGDLTADGRMDVAAIAGRWGFTLFENRGDDSFRTTKIGSYKTHLYMGKDLAFSNFDSDKHMDVAVLMQDSVAVYLSKGDGNFHPEVSVFFGDFGVGRDRFAHPEAQVGLQQMFVGDASHDGWSDIILINGTYDESGAPIANLITLINISQ